MWICRAYNKSPNRPAEWALVSESRHWFKFMATLSAHYWNTRGSVLAIYRAEIGHE